jgi:hypothetical protein
MTFRPGVAANSSRASSTVILRSVSTRMLSLWQFAHRHATHVGQTWISIIAEDLAGLVDHLHLFRRVTGVLVRADLRDEVEGDRVGERLGLEVGAVERGARGVNEFALPPYARRRWWLDRC